MNWVSEVSTEDENEVARLRELNGELEESIKRCRAILNDCRKRLAANTNVLEAPESDEERRLTIAQGSNSKGGVRPDKGQSGYQCRGGPEQLAGTAKDMFQWANEAR